MHPFGTFVRKWLRSLSRPARKVGGRSLLGLESLEGRALPSANPVGAVAHHQAERAHHQVEHGRTIQIDDKGGLTALAQPADDRGGNRRNDNAHDRNDDRGANRGNDTAHDQRERGAANAAFAALAQPADDHGANRRNDNPHDQNDDRWANRGNDNAHDRNDHRGRDR